MRIAAFDLGSNSFHLLVADARPDGSFVPLVQEKEMLRLADRVSRHGVIDADAADAAVDTVRRLRTMAEAAEADEFVACATSAIREAANGVELVERFGAEAGVAVRVISGMDEARLIFEAVRASVLIDPGPAVCLDLGGGSLEVTVGDSAGLLWLNSLKLGVARLTAELVRTDPPDASDLRRVRRRVKDALGPVAADVAAFAPKLLVGTSGTLTDLARLAVARRDGAVPASMHQVRVVREDLESAHRKLTSVTAAERRKLPGMAKRSDLAPAGSTLLLTAMELFCLDELTIGGWALREGMVLDAIARHDPADWGNDPRLLRSASVVDLARRCGWREGHARHVARLAVSLFDQTRTLHTLDLHDRELLEYAGLLHDIGEHVSSEGHHKHTAYLIEHGRLRGFTPDEVAVLATLGRFHRPGEPKTSFEPYSSMAPERRDQVRALLACLQMADGLDRGHACTVDRVDVDIADDAITITVHAQSEADLELWGARRKHELFETVTGRPLAVVAAEHLQPVPVT